MRPAADAGQRGMILLQSLYALEHAREPLGSHTAHHADQLTEL